MSSPTRLSRSTIRHGRCRQRCLSAPRASGRSWPDDSRTVDDPLADPRESYAPESSRRWQALGLVFHRPICSDRPGIGAVNRSEAWRAGGREGAVFLPRGGLRSCPRVRYSDHASSGHVAGSLVRVKWLLRGVPAAAVVAVAVHDLVQRRHALLRNFPVIGHARYFIEAVGPELRQYVVAGNDEERPFSRDQRRWVYASSKLENNYFGFGTDNDIEHTPSYPIVKHATFARVAPPSSPPAGQEAWVPCAKVLGAARGRPGAWRQDSVVNFSAMSFGSLSGPAIEALNRGAALAGCTQNTGEGGLSSHHRHGGDLVFQIGTAYFGCRDEQGRFDIARLKDVVTSAPVRAIEVKLSQGAKPGLGGLLPAAKISPEIAATPRHPDGQGLCEPFAACRVH